jgi:hypothetical protein
VEQSPAQVQLKKLTLENAKTIATIKKLLTEESAPQRDKKILKVLTVLEVHTDEAMRVGLNASAQFIAQAKTGRVRTTTAKAATSAEPRVQSPFSQLMEHHAKQFVDRRIPDAAAQGAAIKYILESFTPELAIKKYNQQLEESQGRYRVSWLTVRKEIGRMQTHGVRPLNAGERNDAQRSQNLDFIADLRGDGGRDYH